MRSLFAGLRVSIDLADWVQSPCKWAAWQCLSSNNTWCMSPKKREKTYYWHLCRRSQTSSRVTKIHRLCWKKGRKKAFQKQLLRLPPPLLQKELMLAHIHQITQLQVYLRIVQPVATGDGASSAGQRERKAAGQAARDGAGRHPADRRLGGEHETIKWKMSFSGKFFLRKAGLVCINLLYYKKLKNTISTELLRERKHFWHWNRSSLNNVHASESLFPWNNDSFNAL